MEKDELLELVAGLTLKNMALKDEIKRLKVQLDKAVKTINAYNDHFEDDDDEYDDEDYYPSEMEEGRDVLDQIEKQDHEANCLHEKDIELIQRFNSINAKLSQFESKILDLDRWTVAQANLADRVSELEEKEDNNGK